MLWSLRSLKESSISYAKYGIYLFVEKWHAEVIKTEILLSLCWEEIVHYKQPIHNRYEDLQYLWVVPSQENVCLVASCTCHYKTVMDSYWLVLCRLILILERQMVENRACIPWRCQWTFEQWYQPEILEEHVWLDKIGESQTYHFLTFSFRGYDIAISHQVLLYSHAT